MKILTTTVMSLVLLLVVSCSDRTKIVYVDRSAQGYVEPEYTEAAPAALYSNCYVAGRGFLGDNGYYYPRGATYRCNGIVYRSGNRYMGSMLGAFAVGYYFSSLGRGYGNYGMYHNGVTNVTNVTVINKGTPAYNKGMKRYNKIQKKRNKNKWVSKSEKKRRKTQSKKAKKAHKKKMVAQKKKAATKKKSNRFSRKSTRSTSTARRKASSNNYRAAKKKSSSRSWSRSSSRSSSRRSSSRRRSDARLKNHIVSIDDALAKLQQIRGVNYFYNNLPNKKQVGVIAQDVQKVLPEAVETNKEGMRSVHYDLIVPLLVEAIKEQQMQIELLKARFK